MEHVETVIVGAGLSGLSAAWFLKGERVVLERGERPGGLCVTHEEQGYRFDVTGHWLHMREPEMQREFGGLVPMASVYRRSRIRTRGCMVPYPFQSNLRALPDDVKLECLLGAVEAHVRRQRGEPVPARFGDYVRFHFGEGIAREFMFPYNTKLWGVEPNGISHDWCQRFVPVPDLRRILEGAFTTRNEGDGYNAAFSYPAEGGIGAFAEALAGRVSDVVRTGGEVVRVHAGERWVELSNGRRIGYRHLVSSMPLKALAERLADAPEEVRAAGARLRCTRLVYFDLGLDRKVLDGLHWIYLPDAGVGAYRVGCYSNAVSGMAPEGGSSLYVELACVREADEEAVLDQVLAVLSEMGPCVGRENVKVWRVRSVEHAYVIYDEAYAAARDSILSFLRGEGIYSVGRYGKWVYASMEDALLDGREAARGIAKEQG
jgi:protoporphyrinogen oxidase